MNTLIKTPPEIKAAVDAQAAEAAARHEETNAQGAVTRAEIEAGAARVGLLGAGVEQSVEQPAPARFGDVIPVPSRTEGAPVSLADATPAMINHAVGAQELNPR